eukprot:SAG31_NODE_6606_length_1954_cov_2.087871_1_plen_158_part_00
MTAVLPAAGGGRGLRSEHDCGTMKFSIASTVLACSIAAAALANPARGSDERGRNNGTDPLLIFTSTDDLLDRWGLIQNFDNPVQPAVGALKLSLGLPSSTDDCAFSGAKVLYISPQDQPRLRCFGSAGKPMKPKAGRAAFVARNLPMRAAVGVERPL